jgi:disulfide oxidoreductase YuzD
MTYEHAIRTLRDNQTTDADMEWLKHMQDRLYADKDFRLMIEKLVDLVLEEKEHDVITSLVKAVSTSVLFGIQIGRMVESERGR